MTEAYKFCLFQQKIFLFYSCIILKQMFLNFTFASEFNENWKEIYFIDRDGNVCFLVLHVR